MLKDLDLDSRAVEGIDFQDLGAARFVAFHWGYDLSGAANGSVALAGGVGVNFGVEGSRDALYAVIRVFKQDPNARTAIADTLDSWKLPRQVKSIEDLDPGTWILTEVNGAFGFKLGAQVGYDYNWIRNVQLKGLTGDVGLRIQAAAEVALGFDVSGKFAVVVGRESLDQAEQKVRLRLYKMRKKGWNFALNAGVDVTPSTGELLPEQLDDFIAGVFGVHGAQIVEDLREIRKWTDPSQPLNTLAGDFLVDFAGAKLSDLVGTDLEEAYRTAHKRITGFLDQWDSLGNRASTALWSVLRGGAASDDIKTFVEFLAGEENSDEAARGRIREVFSRVDFFKTPVGTWLASVATNRILDVLTNEKQLEGVRDAAKTTQEILSGEVIDELVKFVNERLGLDKIRDADFDAIDDRLKEKLSDFLGEIIDRTGLEKIREIIHQLDEKGQQLYKEGVKALNRTYGFSLAYNYQKSTSKDALIDVTLDLGADAALAQALQDAIQGRFRELLVNENENVRLREAALTHQIQRKSHLELNMPYYTQTTDKLNEALAGMKVVEENGRLFVYDLEAEDAIVRQDRWASEFAVSMNLPRRPGIRYFGSEEERNAAATTSYAFRQATKQMTSAQLENQLQPLVDEYFRKEFGGAEAPEKATLSEWVADLDKLFDEVEDNGTGRLGNTLVSLEVSLPGKVLANWLKAPENKKSREYMRMSLSIQNALRRLIPFAYFQRVENYRGANAAAATLLVYKSMPISTSIQLTSSGPLFNRNKKVYWDYLRNDLRDAVVSSPQTQTKLLMEMSRVARMLNEIEGMRGEAGFYAESELGDVLGETLKNEGEHLLRNALLRTESIVIDSAVSAGHQMARFVKFGGEDPEKALEALAKFGAGITSTFNDKLGGLFNPKDNKQLLRNLGVQVFLEATRALGNGLADVQPTAMLDVRVLRGSEAFPPAGYIDQGLLGGDVKVGVAQRVIGEAA